MGQSVKLSDGTYIDAEGVYDSSTQEVLSAKLTRVGTVITAAPSAAGTWIPTTKNETFDLCSVTLPAGTWLLIGQFMCYESGIRIYFTSSPRGLLHGARDTYIAEWRGETMQCFGVYTGNQSISLRLLSTVANIPHTYDTNGDYWGIMAICIG